MWKPASSTPAKRPRRSTTKACCWGTTTAVLATIQKTKMAKTKTTMSTPCMMILPQTGGCRPSDPSFRDQPEREPLDARGPGGAPHLGLARAARSHVLQHHRDLPLHAVHRLGAPCEVEAAHEGAAEEGDAQDGEHGEEEPLQPGRAGTAERRQHPDEDCGQAEEDGEEPAGGGHLRREQAQTDEHPDPPGHDHPS